MKCKCEISTTDGISAVFCTICGGEIPEGSKTQVIEDTHPMPKVKDPNPEDGKHIDITDEQLNPSLPRKEGQYPPTMADTMDGGNWDVARKEVISIQPGDVITIKQDNPIEWLSFCVTEGHSNRVTFPRGKFTLEVYREQVKDV